MAVFITVDDVTVGESSPFALFTVRLSEASSSTVTVGYNQSNGTAFNGSDYQALGNQVLTFTPGQTVKTVQVNLISNTLVEPTESFYFNLFNATNAQIETMFARGIIVDNDATAGTPRVSVSDFVIDEQAREATFAITLDRPSAGAVSMSYSTLADTAGAGDFTATSGSLTFAAGETAKTVKVTLTNDALAELAESFSLQITNLVGATTMDSRGTAVIEANDATPVALPFITVDNVVAGEQDTFASFVVRLSAPSVNTVTVGYNQSNGTALNGSDYQALGNQVLTFAPGETVKTVNVNLLNLATDVELPESFYFNLFSATNARIETTFARATIVDNDAMAGTPVVSVSDFVVDEQAREAAFFITLNRPSNAVVSMNYGTTNGGALAGADFVATAGVLSFAPGETAKTVKVTLINDTAAELAESFSLLISSLVGVTTLDDRGTAVIEANDATPVALPFITVDNVVVGEQDTYANFVVRLSAPSSSMVTVGYNQSNGTALNGSDYQALGNQVLTFAPGETVKTVQVNLLNLATDVEGTESFYFNLFSATNAQIETTFMRATIVDNDATAGTPLVSVSDFVFDERAREASFDITLSRPSGSVVSMNYATVNGTALAGADFTGTSGVLRFAPGETAKTVKVTLANDITAEQAESFSLQITNLMNATTLDAFGTAVIGANDATAVAQPFITVDDVVVGERDAYANFVVRLSAPSASTVTVGYNQSNGTALNGSDYQALGNQVLTFAPGETVKVVQVNVLNPTTDVEAPESFYFNLFSATNARIETTFARATIVDNDATAGTPVVSVNSAVVDEGSGLIQVAFVLDRPSTGNVSVNYALAGLTAASAADFASLPTQNIAFAPGETAKSVLLNVLNDTTAERAELFDVAISSATGATVGAGRGHVIIAASDAAAVASPSITVGNAAAVENDTYMEFRVALNAPSAGTVTVGYNQSNGTALNGSDYQALGNQVLTFAPGETVKVVRVNLLNNTTAESTETFNLNLFSAVNGTIGTTTAHGTIIDDDPAPAVPALVITGTAGPDFLAGTRFADSLTGLGGDDVLDGRGGNDTMAGGTGNDFYIVEQAGDVVNEGASAGTDTVVSYLSYTLTPNVETLILAGAALTGTGNTLNNTIVGTSGNNTLNGGTGIDSMNGGAGNDTYVVDNSADVVTEAAGAGTDTVQSSVTHTLALNVENLTLLGTAAINGTGNGSANVVTGNSAANVLSGGDGNDTLVGAAGNDTLNGGNGNDRQNGGAGNDRHTGGLGLDQYVFDAPLNATTNVDTVNDFASGQDTFRLGKAVFTTIAVSNSVLDAAEFRAAAGATTGADASDRIIYNTTDGSVYFDADGSGATASVLFAKLATPIALTASAFFVEG